MQQYSYRAIDSTGNRKSGKIEASDPARAASILREHGFAVITISEKKEFALPINFQKMQRVSETDITNFTRQLSTMVTAGLPLTDALSILRSQGHGQLHTTLDEIIRDVEGGTSLGAALSKHPQVFSRIYVALIRVGESAGVLDKVLARLSETLEKQREFHSQTKGAMIYPMIVLLGMIGVMAIMMIFVIPKLTGLYEDLGAELPLPTKILITVSGFMSKFWWAIGIVLGGLYMFYQRWKSTDMGEHKMDEIILAIPLIGNLKEKVILAEFTRTLGLLTGAGLPLIEALEIVSDAVDSVAYREGIRRAAKQVEKGLPLYIALEQEERMPTILPKMVRVGEETGKVDEMLLKLSTFFEAEASNLIKNLTTALEPLIMILLGVGVAFLIFTIILPIYKLTGSV